MTLAQVSGTQSSILALKPKPHRTLWGFGCSPIRMLLHKHLKPRRPKTTVEGKRLLETVGHSDRIAVIGSILVARRAGR